MPDDTIPDLSAAIAANAAAPLSATVDGNTVTQQSLADQIAADQYLSSKRAFRRNPLGIRAVKLIPPSAADVDLDCRRR